MRVENGVVVGSNGKCETRNPIASYLLEGFDRAVLESFREAAPSTEREVDFGEGHVAALILHVGVSRVVASDISWFRSWRTSLGQLVRWFHSTWPT